MLGFDGALDASRSARFGQGSGRILLTLVGCEGTEDNLAECAHELIGRYSCSHIMDAGAICYSGTHPSPFQVRLIGGSNDTEGRVEVLNGGSWGTVCDSLWDLRDARVVCRMLGFDGALDAPGSARFGQGSGRILLIYVSCDGTEDNLADCAHRGVGDFSFCGHGLDAGAICYSGAHPSPFQVRLIGGANDAKGRVEVMHDGSWGTVCDWNWDLREARVVCRMLGFDGALDAPKSARFGQGSGRILLGLVRCDGTEDNLAECAHAGIGRYTCSHTSDAGAICYPGKSTSTIEFETTTSLPSTILEGLSTDLGNTSLYSNTPNILGHFSQDEPDNVQSNEVPRILFLLLGISIPVSSIILIAAFVYCLCRSRKIRAKKNIDTTVYMDLMHSRSLDIQNLDSIYQGISSPPKLPERLSAVVSSRKQKSRVALTTSQNTTGVQVHIMGDNGLNANHEYMDMNTIRENPPSSKDEDIDGYLFPTATTSEPRVYMEIGTTTADKVGSDNEIRIPRARHSSKQDAIHKYMDMKPIGQKPARGTEVDLDGYLLPSSTISSSEFTPMVGTRAACITSSGNDKRMTRTRHSDKQEASHEYMHMKHANQNPSTDSDKYLDGYLPTARATKSGSKSEFFMMSRLNTIKPPPDTYIEGYLLPTSTASESEFSSTIVTTSSNVTENDVKTTRTRHTNIQDIDHKYMDMNTVYHKPASGSDLAPFTRQ